MSHGKSDQELINRKHNTARFFVQTRQVSWVLLILTCAWGIYGYISMPQRKDPEVQVRTAVALVPWPGSSAEKVEQLVTRKVEEQMAANSKVTKIESISRTGLAVIYVGQQVWSGTPRQRIVRTKWVTKTVKQVRRVKGKRVTRHVKKKVPVRYVTYARAQPAQACAPHLGRGAR